MHRARPGSIAFRLFLSAIAITFALLAMVGLVLSTLNRSAAERAFDRRLDVYLKTIVAHVANATGTPLPQHITLEDPLFVFPNSGWYWQISDAAGDPSKQRTSSSLPSGSLPRLADQKRPELAGSPRQDYVTGPHAERLRMVERDVDLGPDGHFIVSVAAVASELEKEIGLFNLVLLGTLAFLFVAFVVVVLVQVRYGLKPLQRVSEALAAVRSGRKERLEGPYPDELAPLVREVNALIDANKEIVERARTHVGNLAHALKTPLSVLLNEAAGREDPLAVRVRDQAGLMRDQVAHHLERARMAARVSVVATTCDIAPTVASLVRTMEKIHHTRPLAIDVRILDEVRFRGEAHDIEEMVGNLIDNACKWAVSRVEVEVRMGETREPGDRPVFHVLIDDDGPGLEPERRIAAARRGRRLDESKPGSGLGLSIVYELTSLYGGRLELATAPIGGLRSELVLPAA